MQLFYRFDFIKSLAECHRTIFRTKLYNFFKLTYIQFLRREIKIENREIKEENRIEGGETIDKDETNESATRKKSDLSASQEQDKMVKFK